MCSLHPLHIHTQTAPTASVCQRHVSDTAEGPDQKHRVLDSCHLHRQRSNSPVVTITCWHSMFLQTTDVFKCFLHIISTSIFVKLRSDCICMSWYSSPMEEWRQRVVRHASQQRPLFKTVFNLWASMRCQDIFSAVCCDRTRSATVCHSMRKCTFSICTILPKVSTHPSKSLKSGVPVTSMASGVSKQAARQTVEVGFHLSSYASQGRWANTFGNIVYLWFMNHMSANSHESRISPLISSRNRTSVSPVFSPKCCEAVR